MQWATPQSEMTLQSIPPPGGIDVLAVPTPHPTSQVGVKSLGCGGHKKPLLLTAIRIHQNGNCASPGATPTQCSVVNASIAH